VKQITLSTEAAGIVGTMLFLAALHRILTPPEPAANDLLARARAAIGHVGLAIIALVFVLLNFWKS
jgi:hypothetical protein